MNKKVIFLGGTCNGSGWREKLIPRLKNDYFNPVVAEWNDDAYQEEIEQRANCDICLYVITPRIKGFYSIAEAVDDSIKRSNKTVFYIWENDEQYRFDSHQLKSLKATGELIKKNGAYWAKNFEDLIAFLNK